MLLKQEQNSKLQEVHDFETVLVAIHLLVKKVVNLKMLRYNLILENSQEYV